ncbi:MAG: enoyl-CoA hydratase [Dehalococcoidia bacterium]
MTNQAILLEKDSGIATLTLNRPETMNALNRELRQALADGFRSLAEDGTTRVAILTGAGRAFCAGMDLKEAAEGQADEAAFSGEADVIGAMASFAGPIIGAVNGHAITAGFELALNCDILIASTEARFADTHVRVGMLPGWGLSQRLPRLIGIDRAKEISLTGNYISAEQAEAWGLVNRVVPPDELLPTCRVLAQDIASSDPSVVARYKRLIDEGYGMNLKDALTHESNIATDWAARITSGDIAQNRPDVQERGREQSS